MWTNGSVASMTTHHSDLRTHGTDRQSSGSSRQAVAMALALLQVALMALVPLCNRPQSHPMVLQEAVKEDQEVRTSARPS